MAEEEVNYASVVFKTNDHPPPQAKKEEEETVYDEVKVPNQRTEQTADTNGFLPDNKANRRRRCGRLSCYLGILCVILLLVATGVSVYFASSSPESGGSELNDFQENQTILLAANRKLRSDNENLRRDHNSLTIQLGNLTQNYTVLESKITNLTADLENLRTQNQGLETQIQEMETKRNELNVSRAQWSVEAYCPINDESDERRCQRCQRGWERSASSCYAINNASPSDRKSWEAAREDCRGKSSDFTVIHTDEEKRVVSGYSWGSSGTDGYWIGLRVEDGSWKWIDGTGLTYPSWLPAPVEGHCAMSVQGEGWKSVSCDDRKQWLCKKNAISV